MKFPSVKKNVLEEEELSREDFQLSTLAYLSTAA
jgi:hypothetical protein